MTYSYWPTRLVYGIVGGVSGAVTGALLMMFLAETSWAGVGLAVLVLLGLYGAYRGLAVRVVERPDGLVVHNLWRTYDVKWNEVLRWVDCEPWELKGVHCPGVRTPLRRRPIPLLGMAYWERPFGGETRRAEAFRKTVRQWERRHGG